jgi:hypothetical protein
MVAAPINDSNTFSLPNRRNGQPEALRCTCLTLTARAFLFFEAHQRLAKENPQAIGALGGFCLEVRPLGRWGCRGTRGIRQNKVEVSGAMGTAIALWSSAVARSYAASLWGRPTFGRRLADTTSHAQAVRGAERSAFGG